MAIFFLLKFCGPVIQKWLSWAVLAQILLFGYVQMLPEVSDRQLESQLGWMVKMFPSWLVVGAASLAEAAEWSAYR